MSCTRVLFDTDFLKHIDFQSVTESFLPVLVNIVTKVAMKTGHSIAKHLPYRVFMLTALKELGGISAGELERRFYPYEFALDQFWENKPGKVYKHIRGDNVPQKSFIKHVSTRMETKPEDILDIPLWHILLAPFQINTWRIRAQFSYDVYKRLYKQPKSATYPERRTLRSVDQIKGMANINTLDSLAGLLIFIEDAGFTDKINLYEAAKLEARELFIRLGTQTPLTWVYDDTAKLISNYFLDFDYLNPNWRHQIKPAIDLNLSSAKSLGKLSAERINLLGHLFDSTTTESDYSQLSFLQTIQRHYRPPHTSPTQSTRNIIH